MHVAYQIKGTYKTNAMVQFLCQIIASTSLSVVDSRSGFSLVSDYIGIMLSGYLCGLPFFLSITFTVYIEFPLVMSGAVPAIPLGSSHKTGIAYCWPVGDPSGIAGTGQRDQQLVPYPTFYIYHTLMSCTHLYLRLHFSQHPSVGQFIIFGGLQFLVPVSLCMSMYPYGPLSACLYISLYVLVFILVYIGLPSKLQCIYNPQAISYVLSAHTS